MHHYFSIVRTRLATFSGFSRGNRNSAVRSMDDWVPEEEDGFGVTTGAGSSLSSSSSTRVASASTKKALFLINQSMPTTDPQQ